MYLHFVIKIFNVPKDLINNKSLYQKKQKPLTRQQEPNITWNKPGDDP